MVTYIYFVKCPNCEDEHFDFFDEAKEFALGCLSQKPIITQTEVCRNDFGECTDSCDLGTVWSWEDMMGEGGYTDAEPAKSIFTKDDLKLMADGKDPEFDELDNSVDCEVVEPETSEVSPVERKPIPEGMTIEQLVEEMEENEDTVECTWCNDLFDKSECRKEVDLGWLCSRCEAAIKSRGETLTFRENNYWDFLDENAEPTKKKTWLVFSGDDPIEIGEVYANTEEDAVAEAERKFPDLNYNDYDGAVQVVPADEDLTEASLTDIMAGVNQEYGTNYRERDLLDTEGIDDGEFFDDLETQNEIAAEAQRRQRQRQAYVINKAKAEREARQQSKVEELRDLGNTYDGGYPDETSEVSDPYLKLCPECGKETFDIETGVCVECGFN